MRNFFSLLISQRKKSGRHFLSIHFPPIFYHLYEDEFFLSIFSREKDIYPDFLYNLDKKKKNEKEILLETKYLFLKQKIYYTDFLNFIEQAISSNITSVAIFLINLAKKR